MKQYTIQIQYSKNRKRSVSLKIVSTGVLVQAPSTYSETKIQELIERKKSWIENHWKNFQKKQAKSKKIFTHGSTLPYLGKAYPLTLRYRQRKTTKFGKTNEYFVAYTNKETTQEELLKAFELWEKNHANSLLEAKTKKLGKTFGLLPTNIFVKKYTSKYGMCKGKDVFFDFRIIEFPEGVLEHIILHELTHLIHKHHQKKFREKLASMDENWKTHRDFLKGKIG